MRLFQPRTRGLVWGFLFGTVGVFTLAVLSLMSPVIETLAQPFMWPGRLFSSMLTDGTQASTIVILLLYMLTGGFYALAGVLVQMIIAATKKPGTGG